MLDQKKYVENVLLFLFLWEILINKLIIFTFPHVANDISFTRETFLELLKHNCHKLLFCEKTKSVC